MNDLNIEESFEGDPESFWNSISIWHNNPHLVNKRISGQITLIYGKLNNEFSYEDLIEKINFFLSTNSSQKFTREDAYKIFQDYFILIEKDIFNLEHQENYFSLRKILYKQSEIKPDLELSILEKKSHKITFIRINKKKNISYTLELVNKRIIFSSNNIDLGTYEWFKNKLIPKIISWGLCDNNKQIDNVKSLGLISSEKYIFLYQKLKENYGKKIIEIWPESTDPYKFVYEDISIACYLLLLWEKYAPNKKQSFVDLGCGNGLLVYILITEGHSGFGIDVRKRKIWDLYPENIILKEDVIKPSNKCLFPEIDWIIGNHSDELSPWIPIIASRSSKNCKYFLLPCCAYEFNGLKFQRRDSTKSQYRAFLDYLKEISSICGFETLIDRLKIPSTKRVCLIGINRNYNEMNYNEINLNIQVLLEEKCSQNEIHSDSNQLWIKDFKARDKEEKVKNCTKININIVHEIVNLVIQELLKNKNFIQIQHNGNHWNAGSRMPLKEIAEKIPKEKLNELKNECGGLQTLLRNHNQLFRIIKGNLEIKIPEDSVKFQNNNWKKKQCWFYKNHPDGCPLLEEYCKFNHCD